MAQEVGNIHIGLYVDVGESRRFTQVANVVEQSSRRMNSALGNTSHSVRALRGQMSQSLQFRIAQNSLRDLTRATDATTQLRSAIVGLTSLTTGSLTGAFSAARSEEHTSELQSLMRISYAVFCLKKKIQKHKCSTSPAKITKP